MAKRIGANQRLNKKNYKRNARNKKRSFFSRLFLIMKIICILLAIGLVTYYNKDRLLPYIADFDILKIKKIKVSGNKQTDATKLITSAAIDSSMNLLVMPFKNIEKRIKSNHWVENVKLKRRFPNTINISIKERKPIAIVNIQHVYLVDKTGYMWSLKPNSYWDVPIVSGLKDTCLENNVRQLKERDLERMCRFFNDIEECETSLTDRISQVDFSHNEILYIKLASNPVTIMFKNTEVKKSIRNLNEILYRIENDTTNITKHINLCYKNIAYVN